ncbi:clock-controlled 6 (CCG-6) [Apiospora saccharicola]
MQYSFAVAALIAGASAQYQVAPPPAAVTTSSAVATTSATQAYPVESKSTAAVESSKSYPVESKTTEAVQSSKSTPAASYPVVATAPANNGTVSSSAPVVKYTTEVVNQYTTYCPGPTTITHGTKTYTVTAPTTLTITDCPCTVSKPVFTTSAVVCNGASCSGKPAPPPTYNNGTVPAVPAQPTTLAPAPTGGYPTKPTQATTPSAPIPTAGAAKVAFGGFAAAIAAVFVL